MLKTKLVFLMCALSFFNAVQAEQSIILDTYPGTFIHVAAEGSWTFKTGGSFDINLTDIGYLQGTKTFNEAGFRVSAGAQKYLCPNFALVGDVGYGYYGKTNFFFQVPAGAGIDPDFVALNEVGMHVTKDGFDALAGLSYDILKGVDLSLQAGAMLERSRTTINLNAIGIPTTGADFNITQLLPVLRFGGSIKFCRDIYLTAAYMHVFGVRPNELIVFNGDPPIGSMDVARESTIMDTLFIGIKWNITELC